MIVIFRKLITSRLIVYFFLYKKPLPKFKTLTKVVFFCAYVCGYGLQIRVVGVIGNVLSQVYFLNFLVNSHGMSIILSINSLKLGEFS